ncbi:MAG: preprotein translocase subunit YajC [Clostridia bacterium]|nr:preprotein translocase subunit YajC [Clostridia bacterium]
MLNNILKILCFFEDTAADTGSTIPSWVSTVVIVAIMALLIVMMIIPQRRNKKKAEEMKKSLRVGSMITTIGGIVGQIIALDDKGNFTLETGIEGSKTTMSFTSGALYMVNNPENATEEKKQEDSTDEIK